MAPDFKTPRPAQRRYLELLSQGRGEFQQRDGDGIELILDDVNVVNASEGSLVRGFSDLRPGVYYESPYFRLVQDAVRFPDGTLGLHARVLPGDGVGEGVAILPRVGPKVALVHHFRHATRNWHLEIPRGFGHPGEAPARAAAREILEELGSPALELTSLGLVLPDSGILATRVHLYLAELSATGEPDHGEGIDRVVELDRSEFEDFLRNGKIDDSFALAAYARASLFGLW